MNAKGVVLPMPARMRETSLRSLSKLLWQPALAAIPFALFFAGINNAWSILPRLYLVAVVFSYANGIGARIIGIWREHRELGRSGAVRSRGSRRNEFIMEAAAYGAMAIVASFAAAWFVGTFISPDFFRGGTALVSIALFALLFCALFIGIGYAMHFYEEALVRARADEELTLARRIQRSFLLSNFPARGGIEVHAVNVSSKQVSGDFYDVVPVGERATLLCIADVSGKGVPAALLGSMLQASLRTQAPITASVGSMVTNVNALLCQGAGNGQFATMFLGRMDEHAMRLDYVNAGHNHPVLFRASGERVVLDRGGPMVGILDGVPFDEGSVPLEPGDRIVLYTDGLSEAMNARNEMFGDDRLVDFAGALPRELDPRESTDAILRAIDRFLGGVEAQDDMTLMVVRVPGRDGRASSIPAALPAGVAS